MIEVEIPKRVSSSHTSICSKIIDNRCFVLEKGCWNDNEKKKITNVLIEMFQDELLEQTNENRELREAVQKIKKEINWVEVNKKIRFSKIKDLLEFSRAIHAEMHTIILGSQTAGERVKNGKLYVTTYPCCGNK